MYDKFSKYTHYKLTSGLIIMPLYMYIYKINLNLNPKLIDGKRDETSIG